MNSQDIFISYSRKDAEKVNQIVDLLKEQGFSVWIDTYGIESGEAFRGIIVDAIENAKIVLFFSSEYSNKSEWTKKEIALAVDSNKHVIPIKLDNSKYNKDIRLDLITLDYIDLTRNLYNKPLLDKLFRTIRNILTPIPLPPTPIPPEPKPFWKSLASLLSRNWKSRNNWVNVFLCALGILAVVGIFMGGLYWIPAVICLIGMGQLFLNRGNGYVWIALGCFVWMMMNAWNFYPNSTKKFFAISNFLQAWLPLCIVIMTAIVSFLKKKGRAWREVCSRVSVFGIICLTVIGIVWLGAISYDLIFTKYGLAANMHSNHIIGIILKFIPHK